MKKVVIIVLAMLLLTGCGVETFETIDDLNDTPAAAKPVNLLLDLPADAASPAIQGTSGTLYFCGDYDIMVEVMPSGNLNSTLQTLTGFERTELEILETLRCGVDCYESAWSAAGEAGDCVGRVLVLDDGNFHYCVSIMAMAENVGENADEWNTILSSVALAEG